MSQVGKSGTPFVHHEQSRFIVAAHDRWFYHQAINYHLVIILSVESIQKQIAAICIYGLPAYDGKKQ
jgi:hypothetical protein